MSGTTQTTQPPILIWINWHWQYKKIPHLHSKFYLNEKYGIVTSMNLLLSSEINSLEIGYVTETWMEYNDLSGFYYRYIHIGEPVQYDTMASQAATDLKEIMHRIRETLNKNGKNSWFCSAENSLHISTGSHNYKVSFNDGFLRITAHLRIAPATRQKNNWRNSFIMNSLKDTAGMEVYMRPGLKPDTIQLSGQAQVAIRSTCMATLLEGEASYIMESVIRFIYATDGLTTS